MVRRQATAPSTSHTYRDLFVQGRVKLFAHVLHVHHRRGIVRRLVSHIPWHLERIELLGVHEETRGQVLDGSGTEVAVPPLGPIRVSARLVDLTVP